MNNPAMGDVRYHLANAVLPYAEGIVEHRTNGQ
jgi:hypothetical protein